MTNVQVLIPKTMDHSEAIRILSHQSLSMREANGNIEVKVSKGAIMSPGGITPYGMAMTASWDSLENFIAWAQSPAGDKDKDVLLENGATLVFYEVED
jgi:heme-degrading monooxygenase HmoA